MGQRSIVEGITPQARRVRRRELGKLRDLVVKPATKRRYEEAATIFFAYLKANKEPLPTQPHDLEQIVGHYLKSFGGMDRANFSRRGYPFLFTA